MISSFLELIWSVVIEQFLCAPGVFILRRLKNDKSSYIEFSDRNQGKVFLVGVVFWGAIGAMGIWLAY